MSKQHRWALYAVFAVLLATGLIWLWAQFFCPDPALQAAAQAWSMKIHGAAMLGAFYLCGTLWARHIRAAWAQRHNRLAGGVFSATVLALGLSGYGLYYFNGEALRGAAEWLHWIAGLAVCALFWLHIQLGRRQFERPLERPFEPRDQRG
jgi:hypothetical protein